MAGTEWNRMDERFWNEKSIVFCPYDGDAMLGIEDCQVPEGCPFTLEHLVSGGKHEANQT